MQSSHHPIESEEANVVRSHPWTVSATNADHQYYNFRRSPELIPNVLEDFIPWRRFEAIQTFYGLLRWMITDDSVFDSNDSAFIGPHPTKSHGVPLPIEVSGRLMIFFRDIALNITHMKWLEETVQHHLQQIDSEFTLAFVGTTLMQTKYDELEGQDEKKLGFLLKLSFWAWGNDEETAMQNLNRLFENLRLALQEISKETQKSLRTNEGWK